MWENSNLKVNGKKMSVWRNEGKINENYTVKLFSWVLYQKEGEKITKKKRRRVIIIKLVDIFIGAQTAFAIGGE